MKQAKRWMMSRLEDLSLEFVKRHEGYRKEPYLDSLGVPTIGIGRNLEAHPISKKDCEAIKRYAKTEKDPFLKWHEAFALEEIKKIISRLRGKIAFFDNLSVERQAVLVDMSYCLGEKLFLFKETLSHLEKANYPLAAKALLDSAFAKQTGIRAKELAMVLEAS